MTMIDPRDMVVAFSALPGPVRAVASATLIIAAVGIVTSAARRASASTRHALWLLGIVGSLVTALVASYGPVVTLETETLTNAPGAVPFGSLPEAYRMPSSFGVAEDRAGTRPAVRSATPAVNAGQSPINVAQSAGGSMGDARADDDGRAALRLLLDHGVMLCAASWLLGMIVVLGRAIAGHIGIARIMASSHPAPDALSTLIERSAREAGILGTVDIRVSADLDGPFTAGTRRPVVVLPAESIGWTSERLHVVLVHELAHVARRDHAAQLVATVACAIYWFNPLIWLAAARMRGEAEQAADDRVLLAGFDGVTYASHLLELARSSANTLATASAVGIAHSTRLERRFQAMLDSRRPRRIVSRAHQAAGTLAVIAMAVPLAGFRVVAGAAAPASATTVAPSSGPSSPAGPAVASRIPDAPRSELPPTTPHDASAPSGNGSTVTTSLRTPADTIIEGTLAASAGERLSIDLPTGATMVIRAWDQSQVRLRAKLSGDQAMTTQLRFERRTDGAVLTTTVPPHSGTMSNSNEVELWVPLRFDIHIVSAGGAIRIEGVEGSFTGQTGGGEIVKREEKGDARLRTGGGDIHLSRSHLTGQVTTGGGQTIADDVTGGVTLTSGSTGTFVAGQGGRTGARVGPLSGQSSGGVWSNSNDRSVDGREWFSSAMSKAGGAIRLDDAPNGGRFITGGGEIEIGSSGGRLSVTTGGGDITLPRVAGDVMATTGSGDIEITVVNPDGSSRTVEAYSGTGKVTITLPAGIDVRFDLETAYTQRNGPTKIQSDFQVALTETTEWDATNGTPRRYVRATGTSGSGAGLVKIRTVNGDVVIRRR